MPPKGEQLAHHQTNHAVENPFLLDRRPMLIQQ